MPTRFVFVPPQTDVARGWAARLREQVPELEVVVPETADETARALRSADAAFGTLPAELLDYASELRWLQAPAIAPPAGYYYPELVQHPVQVTNFRGIFNEHIAAHILAFVLAFSRGFQRYFPQQVRREWSPAALDEGIVYLPDATALMVGVGGI